MPSLISVPPYFEKMISSPLSNVDRDALALLVQRAGADCEHAATLRLLLGGVRQDDAARENLLLVENLDDEAVAQRLQIHERSSFSCLELDSLWHSPVRECQTPDTLARSAAGLASGILALRAAECQR